MASPHAESFDFYDVDVDEMRTQSRASSPDLPLALTAKALGSPPGNCSSSSADESEEEDQLVSDYTDEDNAGPPRVGKVGNQPKKTVTTEASEAPKEKQKARKARPTKADSIYDREIHVPWVTAVS